MADKIRLWDLLPIMRDPSFCRMDEYPRVIISPESETWTWIYIPLSSGILDLLGDLIVTNIGADNDFVQLWIETGDFNVPKLWKGGEPDA